MTVSQNRQATQQDVRSQLDLENNSRSEIWSIHVGEALGLDLAHFEGVVQQAIDGAAFTMSGHGPAE